MLQGRNVSLPPRTTTISLSFLLEPLSNKQNMNERKKEKKKKNNPPLPSPLLFDEEEAVRTINDCRGVDGVDEMLTKVRL